MYDLEIDEVIEEVRKTEAKTVCIQLADGLKPKAKEIQDKVEKNTNARVLIWGGSCFGACDLPVGLKVDLLIHFGHSYFNKPNYNVG